MRTIKHAFLSLVRKPSKAVMILLIMVLVFSLVFTGIIISNSIEESRQFIRKGLGAVVRFEVDWMKAMTDGLSGEEYENLQLNEATALDIGSDRRVKATYLIVNAYLMAPGLKPGTQADGPFIIEERVTSKGEISDVDIIDIVDPGMEGPGMNLIGSNNPVPIEFEVGMLTLSDGRHITRQELERGDRVILISEEFAAVNNLSPDDVINMKTWEAADTTEYTIAGIYSGAPDYTTENIYTTSAVIEEANAMMDYPMEGFSSVYFVLEDPLEIEGFIADSTEKLPSKYTKLTASDEEYKKLTKPLDLMELITNILIWVVFGAGAMIIIAVVVIFIRDRKFEIGLLLSTGEGKHRIAGQFILEIAMVALLSFTIAAGASQLTSRYVGNWIAENQLVDEAAMEGETDFDTWISPYDGSIRGDVDFEDVAEEFNVSVDFSTVLNLLGISMGLLVIAAGAPLVTILRYRPRQALMD